MNSVVFVGDDKVTISLRWKEVEHLNDGREYLQVSLTADELRTIFSELDAKRRT